VTSRKASPKATHDGQLVARNVARLEGEERFSGTIACSARRAFRVLEAHGLTFVGGERSIPSRGSGMFPNRICQGAQVNTNALRDFPAPTALALDRQFPSAR